MDENLLKIIDRRFAEQYSEKEPGAVVILTKHGEIVFRKAYGLANLELLISIEADMVFRLGSITKQFTAVAILMLQDQNYLSLQDPITRFLPGIKTHNHVISIEHLLTHTSGIKNYTDLPSWKAVKKSDISVEELMELFVHRPLQFTPGERFSYSNSGYVLLGAIIEKITEMPYRRFIQTQIFELLGMKNSYYDTPDLIIPGRASGYQKKWDEYCNAEYISMTQPYAAGGLASNVDDLAIWDAALYTDKLVSQEKLRKAFIPARLNNGCLTNYGYGWQIATRCGHQLLSHDGHIEGFSSNAIRVPDDRLFVAVLSNNQAKQDLPKVLSTEVVQWAIEGSIEKIHHPPARGGKMAT